MLMPHINNRTMHRLIVISNRLPVSTTKDSAGIHFSRSIGGLATGLASFGQSHEMLWIGWPGITSEKLTHNEKTQVAERLAKENCHPVHLSRKQIKNYYEGFSNKTIWPLFHYFSLYTVYEEQFWQAYKQVNSTFCDAIVEVADAQDQIWIHDYQLMLLPELIRRKLPEAQIGFFLHIPFPSFELLRLLPWRSELLHGILGADLIGFHTYDYVRHFLSSAARIAGTEHSMGALTIGNRLIKVDAFPMGIDYEKYAGAVDTDKVKSHIAAIREKVGQRKIVISIDRLDYTKGIIERLEAFDLFLTQNRQYKGKVTLILLAVPSRTGVDNYMKLRERLESLISRINGEQGLIGWVPVWYLYRAVPFERLVALYSIADVALLTPLRDGMNLIAKEFIATKTKGTGTLILSEMAGAASELAEAVVVNARDKAAIVRAIKEAIEMPVEQQIKRNRLMQDRLSRYTVTRWANDFIEALGKLKAEQQKLSVNRLTAVKQDVLIEEYRKGKRRLLLLDYDGTLVGFAGRPEQAEPDEEILTLLKDLTADKRNEVMIISGRDKTTLADWLGHLPVSLAAEHGAWIKNKQSNWQVIEPLRNEWKDTIRPILELYADRTAGSSVEEKDFSLVWHYRKSDPELAYVRTQELRDAILNLTENLGINMYEGSKILEIKNVGVNKATVAELWLAKQNWDFILAAGDDYTDEDMFAVMPQNAYSIKIGASISKAKYNLDGVQELRTLLGQLLNTDS